MQCGLSNIVFRLSSVTQQRKLVLQTLQSGKVGKEEYGTVYFCARIFSSFVKKIFFEWQHLTATIGRHKIILHFTNN
jgi:hypothetical protein